MMQHYGPAHGYPAMMHGPHGPYQNSNQFMFQNKQDSEVSPENNAGQDSQLNEEQQVDDNKSYTSSRQNK